MIITGTVQVIANTSLVDFFIETFNWGTIVMDFLSIMRISFCDVGWQRADGSTKRTIRVFDIFWFWYIFNQPSQIWVAMKEAWLLEKNHPLLSFLLVEPYLQSVPPNSPMHISNTPHNPEYQIMRRLYSINISHKFQSKNPKNIF